MQTLQTTQNEYYKQTSNTESVRGYYAPKLNYIYSIYMYITYSVQLKQLDKCITFSL